MASPSFLEESATEPARTDWGTPQGQPRRLAESRSVMPGLVRGPVLDPAGKARFSGGVPELLAEGDSADVSDQPDVSSVRSGHDEMPVHRASVGAEHDRAVVVDLLKDLVGILELVRVFLPHP
jgi:hypothetical protein